MGTEKTSRWAQRVFTFLMRKIVDAAFKFPGGAVAERTVAGCMENLDAGTQKLSHEKIVDFCVCQVYAIAFFDKEYLRRWKPSHSFGEKALERFTASTRARRYYENLWLQKYDISRAELVELILDRSRHPLSKFIYPEYEDATKARHVGSKTGLYVCSVSTLMWTPFSPVCRECMVECTCRELMQKHYPELFRIRVEAWKGERS